jgi:hypothetical protein
MTRSQVALGNAKFFPQAPLGHPNRAAPVRANWRIIFRFEGGEACDVDLIDYH